MRQFVVGDIHGCGKALRTLIEVIDPDADDVLIFLGDYIDRGPDSKDVVQQIIDLQKRCRVIALRGNHEIMLLGVVGAGLDSAIWMNSGGQATVASYGGSLKKIPRSHMEFFRSLRPYYLTEKFIFVHANYIHDKHINEQEDSIRYWTHLSYPYPPPHHSGRRVFVGHTPQPEGTVLDIGHLVCMDTYCFGGGYLSAMELSSGEIIQVDRHGHPRRTPLKMISDRLIALTERIRRALGRTDGCTEQVAPAKVDQVKESRSLHPHTPSPPTSR